MTTLSERYKKRKKIQRKKIRKKVVKLREVRVETIPKPPKEVKRPKIRRETEYNILIKKLRYIYNDVRRRNRDLQSLKKKIKLTRDEKLRYRMIDKYSRDYKVYIRKKKEYEKLLEEKGKYIEKITRSIIFTTKPTKVQIDRETERNLEIILTLHADRKIVTPTILRELIDIFRENNIGLETGRLDWEEGEKQPLGLTEYIVDWSKDKTIEIELKYNDLDYTYNSKTFEETAFTLEEARQRIRYMSIT